MDEERRRQLLAKGRESLQKHRQAKAHTGEHTPTSHNSSAHVPSTPDVIENGAVFRSPSSPSPISSISLDPLPLPPNFPHYTGHIEPSHAATPVMALMPAFKSATEADLEAKLALAHTSLVAAQAESQQLKSENQSLRSTTMQLQSERDQLKRQFEELVQSSSETLTSQQTALNKAHAAEIAHIRTQLNLGQTESAATIDQLKRDKAEMQGMVHLLQQQLSTFSSTTSSDNVLLEEAKMHSSRLSAQLKEVSMQLEASNAVSNQRLETQSQAHRNQLDELRHQHDHLIATLKLDHASEIQQLRNQPQNQPLSKPETSIPSPDLESHHHEIQTLQSTIKSHQEQLKESELSKKAMQTEIAENSKIIADLNEKLKRASDQSKTLQSQTSANFAQVEQMKQQVLRDRADLSKKLSLIAPETIRRVEQLQSERDAINAQFLEMSKSLTELARQKNDILTKLATEVSRNAALVHQNSQLRHDLSLQLSAIGEPQSIVAAPETSIPDQSLEETKTQLQATTNLISSDPTDADTIMTEITKLSESAVLDKKKNQRNKLGRRKVRSTALLAHEADGNPSVKPNGANHLPSNPEGSNQGPNQGQTGWLSSMPLVGRLWRGQTPIKHTAQVEL